MSANRLRPIFVTMICMITMAGCHRQAKPQPLVPAPMLPLSAIIPPPEVLPPGEDEPVVTAPSEPATTTANKPKPRPRNGRRISDVPKPSTSATNQPPVVAPETPPSPPPKITTPSHDVPTTATISEGLPHSDEMHHKETAAQLNQSTEENLRSIKRTLTASEKSIVEQIRSFISQSQDAIADNDLVRAHNLALKAHLLSDELANR
jgi:hypothetical protein